MNEPLDSLLRAVRRTVRDYEGRDNMHPTYYLRQLGENLEALRHALWFYEQRERLERIAVGPKESA